MKLFQTIGLASQNGNFYREREHKNGQLHDYLIKFRSILKKMSKKRTLVLLDCGCGRSYLSFYLNYMLKMEGYNNLQFIGIDTNIKLMEKNRVIANELGFENMLFMEGNIINCELHTKADIVL